MRLFYYYNNPFNCKKYRIPGSFGSFDIIKIILLILRIIEKAFVLLIQ